MYIVLSKLELECDVDIGYLHPSFIVAFSLFLPLVFMYLSLSLFHMATILYGTY